MTKGEPKTDLIIKNITVSFSGRGKLRIIAETTSQDFVYLKQLADQYRIKNKMSTKSMRALIEGAFKDELKSNNIRLKL